VEQAHGRRSIETLRAVAPEMDAERENLNVEQLEIDDWQGVSALAGAAQLLRSLPPEWFAIVTSATRRWLWRGWDTPAFPFPGTWWRRKM
jgi:sugar-phosphatase